MARIQFRPNLAGKPPNLTGQTVIEVHLIETVGRESGRKITVRAGIL
jgi:hypothetical protein